MIKKISKAKQLLILIIVVLVVSGYLFFYRGHDVIYLTEYASIRDIEVNILSDGKMEAQEQVDVGAQVSGQIKKMHVKLGDIVTKGQLLVEIDDLTQKNDVKDGEARLKNSIASKFAKDAQLMNAKVILERQKRLIKDGATTQSEMDLAEANLKVLMAELEAQQAQVAQARIALDTSKLYLTYTKITSPMDGVVVATVVKEGQTVNSTQTAPTIVKVANLSKMTIKAQISEADVTKVKLGMPAYFTILGDSREKFRAALKQIEPATEEFQIAVGNALTNTDEAVYYNGLLDVENREQNFYIGMTTQVYLVVDEVKQVVSVSNLAFNYTPSGKAPYPIQDANKLVWIKTENGKIVPREVVVGISNNIYTEIKSGLHVGDNVIVTEIAVNES